MPDIKKITEKPEDSSLQDDMEVTINTPNGKVTRRLSELTPSDVKQAWENLRKFNGIMKDNPIFSGDSVELQRKMRYG
jgi:hypothetical protein